MPRKVTKKKTIHFTSCFVVWNSIWPICSFKTQVARTNCPIFSGKPISSYMVSPPHVNLDCYCLLKMVIMDVYYTRLLTSLWLTNKHEHRVSGTTISCHFNLGCFIPQLLTWWLNLLCMLLLENHARTQYRPRILAKRWTFFGTS